MTRLRESVRLSRPVQVECIPDGTPMDLHEGDCGVLTQALGSSFTLVFEGQGRITEYAGGYQDWLRQRPQAAAAPAAPKPAAEPPKPKPVRSGGRKLGFNEKRELESLPARIEVLEAELERLQGIVSSADFYRQDSQAIAATLETLEQTEAELAAAYARWEELESLA